MKANWTKFLCSSLSGHMAGRLAGVFNGNRQGHDTTVSRPAAGVRPVIKSLLSLILVLLSLFAPEQGFSAANGISIVNKATFTCSQSVPISSSVTVTVIARTKATIEFLEYSPLTSGAPLIKVPTTYYQTGGSPTDPFMPVPPPVQPGSLVPIDLSVPVPLIHTNLIHVGQPVFVRVADQDQNLDSAIAETIITTIIDPTTGDTETLRLTETGPDSGVFIGYIQTSSASAVNYNGSLSVVVESNIEAHYTDKYDGTDIAAAAALVDPFGKVFDSTTGKPINGVKVEIFHCLSLTDCSNNELATVYGDDGISSFPATVITGGTASDSSGVIYQFSPGGYRFPFLAPGNYQIRITPVVGYTAPSTATNLDIETLPGGPFATLKPGSRGEIFTIPTGPAIKIDIPVDPASGTLWLRKIPGKNLVSAGEFLSYELTLENNDPVKTFFSAVVTDKLPAGFRYQKGSARLKDVSAPDPALSPDGSTMTFAVGDIPPATSVTIRYIVAVGAVAKAGTATNRAVATTDSAVTSNVAKADVQVQEPFILSRSIIMGRVIVGACSENIEDNKKGMEGVGIYLEDGTFVISDKLGMFHFEGVRPGSHVVQLDLDSIPEGYKVLPCEQNSRFAGRAYSQFVDMQGGTMWRTDFYLGRTELTHSAADDIPVKSLAGGKSVESAATPLAPVAGQKVESLTGAMYKGEITLEMISSQSGDFIDYRIPLQAAMVPLTNLRLTVTLPPGAIYLNGSSNFDGTALSDPEVSAGRLSYSLGSAGTDWQKELRFRVTIDRKALGGELQTKAALTFDSPTAKDILAPEMDNLLSLVKEESRISLPAIVLHPQFPTFGAELSEEDCKQLDELALVLSRFKINHIDVVGHTDNVRIAPRSRNIYGDNTALSFARARSVGRYLAAALHLPPENLNLWGRGEKEPIATNRTAAGRATNRRVEVNASVSQGIETTHLKIIKERSGLKKQETIGGPIRPTGGESNRLSPLPPKDEAMAAQPAANAAEAILSAGNPPPAAPSQPGNLQGKSAPQKKSAASALAKNEERVELISALSEGIVHYRIKLAGVKGPLKKVTATLVTPKSFLYMTGTTRLSGSPVADPETKESIIAYTFATLPDENKFDLRLQSLIDGDDQAEALSSSVTVVIADADGKPLKTLTATSELSDSMEEIIRPDIPATAENSAPQGWVAKDESKNINEYVEKVPMKGDTGKAETPNPDAGLHVKESEGILSPVDGTVIASQINAVRIVLNSALTPVLTLDGKEIPADRIGFKMKDRESEKTLYTYIGVDFGDAGEHILQLKGMDTFGLARFDKSAIVTRTGEITSIRLVSAEGNVADGRTPVRVRIQLFDKDDKPVMANAELAVKGSDLRPWTASDSGIREVSGLMVTVDGEGWITFQPVTSSGLYRVQLAYNKAQLDVETYVKPKMRDWILVGLAEGTVGYNTVSGNMENLTSSGQEDNLYDKERLALYAKGTIKGEWLLTMAYDSEKQRTGVAGNALFQTIDPNSYYTIYGDASSQMYDSASQRKLYLKIERDQFYAMFGDFNTGLTVTELSRYSRSMNGIKSEFRSKDFEATVFGSETGQSFVKDELRGDGTSGLYRLTRRGIVLNSEKITIESRDRFHSEVITDSRQMSRFIDYSIDYDTGAIFFKSPVPSRDEKFDPVYIVVDYEIANAGSDALTYGGRAAARMMNGRLQVGGTYVREGQVSGESNLYGVDASALLAPGTKARAEFATTNSDFGLKRSGNAYLAEVTHSGRQFDSKFYFKEQEEGFGLGQQQGTETGTRKYGVEAGYKLNSNVTLNAQGYRQYNLTTGAVRNFIETLASYNEKQYSLRTGIRYANDTLPDGNNATSVLATVGGSWKTRDQKLTLRADHDQALFSKNVNADFPTRTILGVDYQVTKAALLFAQEELTYGAADTTNTTRVGIKATPWSGGTVNSSVVNDLKENSERTFANVGLTQKWQLNPRWTVDGGLDHSQTIRKKTGYKLYANVPPASGGEDFTAVSLGANYQEKKLTWSNRVEYRDGETENKWGLISGLINEQGLNWGWTGRLQLLHTQSTGDNSRTDADLRFGLVYRPPVTRWIVLDRLDLITTDERSTTASTKGRRVINNLNANWKPNRKTQLSLQYGAKYVLDTIDGIDFSGYTDLYGAELRYDLTKEWDIGLYGSILHSWNVDQFDYGTGASVGYNVAQNSWISLGYNLTGFTDKDFSAANYTAKGPYVRFRFKFDQNSVKDAANWLNNN